MTPSSFATATKFIGFSSDDITVGAEYGVEKHSFSSAMIAGMSESSALVTFKTEQLLYSRRYLFKTGFVSVQIAAKRV